MATELERSRDLRRVIVHVDMDAFYAAVEMRDCPELKDKPMAVGSMSMLVGRQGNIKNYSSQFRDGGQGRPFFEEFLCSPYVCMVS